MDAVQLRIFILDSTINKKNDNPKVCSKKFLSNFDKLSPSDIKESAVKLLSIYKNDLDSNLEFEFEFQDFYANLLKFDIKNKISREQAMYSLIIETGALESFPNVEMILRIHLTRLVIVVERDHSQN